MDFDADNERTYRQAPNEDKLFSLYERIEELQQQVDSFKAASRERSDEQQRWTWRELVIRSKDRWTWTEGESVPRYMWSQIPQKDVVSILNRSHELEAQVNDMERMDYPCQKCEALEQALERVRALPQYSVLYPDNGDSRTFIWADELEATIKGDKL